MTTTTKGSLKLRMYLVFGAFLAAALAVAMLDARGGQRIGNGSGRETVTFVATWGDGTEPAEGADITYTVGTSPFIAHVDTPARAGNRISTWKVTKYVNSGTAVSMLVKSDWLLPNTCQILILGRSKPTPTSAKRGQSASCYDTV